MSEKPQVLTPDELDRVPADLPDWQVGDGHLDASYRCPSAAAALALIAAVGRLAEELNHHPDVDWRYNTVVIRSGTHEAGDRITGRDVALATRISALASAYVDPIQGRSS
ncbi:4a-hydroxytetrahydrobiopterin dehydratase [Nakamurella silvestris]|nr:4a-hydroxytetrahydrobiopterin dehydratase [Nakamurella silvestris]